MTNQMSDANRAYAVRVALTFMVTGACSLALLVSIFLLYATENPLTPAIDPALRLSFVQILPEGWAFFTKSQRDPYFELYRYDGRTLVQAFDGPQSEPRNLLGIRRLPRAEGIEAGFIETALGDKHMATCSDSVEACVASLHSVFKMRSSSPHPILCGDFVFITEKPVPFEWAHFAHVTMPLSLAKVHVAC
jgi:antimicrobial peptide system SdpA family protein